ncbi:hypothetical protein RSAG8_03869, partial [Rhizoctonia solani AG-8 WAC10335]
MRIQDTGSQTPTYRLDEPTPSQIHHVFHSSFRLHRARS